MCPACWHGEYLHEQSPPVVHRDIKPQNLKLTPTNGVVLLDFGLARGAAGGQTQMLSGAALAGYTSHYPPIEQRQGGVTDARADLYGFGATLVLEHLTDIRTRTKTRKQTRTSRKVHRWSFAQLKCFIVYKAEERGCTVAGVDPRHASQTC